MADLRLISFTVDKRCVTFGPQINAECSAIYFFREVFYAAGS